MIIKAELSLSAMAGCVSAHVEDAQARTNNGGLWESVLVMGHGGKVCLI